MESPMRNPTPTRDESCEKHGAFQSINFAGQRWSGCPKCAAEERSRANEESDRLWRKDRIDTRLRHSGLEGRFREASFADFEVSSPAQEKALETCKEYAASVVFNGGAGLWLIGPPGTGKTHLGSAMVRHVIEERDMPAGIFSGREIIRMLRATWGNRDRARDWDGRATCEEDLIHDLGHLGLLVIDEIGIGFGSEAEHVQLFDVIDLRYKLRRPTVLLSNLPAKGLKDAMGDRAYDRLREGAQVLACNWDSYRGKPPSSKPSLEVVR